MKDLKLDILNRADDDIIDSLVPFSSDDKKTKKRILAMSEKKLAELQRGSESETNEISVRGVEQYRRPVCLHPPAAQTIPPDVTFYQNTSGFRNRRN